jgi:3,4-dehydroadipyl-CoA semialdehyde dehydrogenase
LRNARILKSYVAGQWLAGKGRGHDLVNPSNGDVVAWCNTEGLDFSKAVAFARDIGGPALRALSFSERATLLGKIAELLASRRDRWHEIARVNSGNTRADAVIDVDGAIATVKYFARLGASLGNAKILIDGPPTKLTRDPNFQAVHIGVPLQGVAIHINAYNFPAWGLWEKTSVSLLAGLPVLSKPATATAWLAQEMVQCVIESGILPEGGLSITCGPIGNLLECLQVGDIICFTGSAATAQLIRNHLVVQHSGIRINIEADSLNAAILGPDVQAGSPAFDLFVREVVKEMTSKTGQKCTAIRRVLVPESQSRQALDAISAHLQQMKVGDPANPDVTVGPLVNMVQRIAVEEGIRKLASASEVVYQATPLNPVDADMDKGAFVGPTLLRASASESHLANEIEVFGPVATLISYRDKQDAFSIAEGGRWISGCVSVQRRFWVPQ